MEVNLRIKSHLQYFDILVSVVQAYNSHSKLVLQSMNENKQRSKIQFYWHDIIYNNETYEKPSNLQHKTPLYNYTYSAASLYLRTILLPCIWGNGSELFKQYESPIFHFVLT